MRLSKRKKAHDEKVKAAETEYEKTIFYAKKQKEAGIITEEQYKELEAAAKAHKDEQIGTSKKHMRASLTAYKQIWAKPQSTSILKPERLKRTGRYGERISPREPGRRGKI